MESTLVGYSVELELSALEGGPGRCLADAVLCGLIPVVELALLPPPQSLALPLLSKLLAAGNDALLRLLPLPYSILSFGLP